MASSDVFYLFLYINKAHVLRYKGYLGVIHRNIFFNFIVRFHLTKNFYIELVKIVAMRGTLFIHVKSNSIKKEALPCVIVKNTFCVHEHAEIKLVLMIETKKGETHFIYLDLLS